MFFSDFDFIHFAVSTRKNTYQYTQPIPLIQTIHFRHNTDLELHESMNSKVG